MLKVRTLRNKKFPDRVILTETEQDSFIWWNLGVFHADAPLSDPEPIFIWKVSTIVQKRPCPKNWFIV